MTALVGAEFLKLRSTRTAYGFLAAIVLLTLGVVAATSATVDLRTKEDLEEALSGAGILGAKVIAYSLTGGLLGLAAVLATFAVAVPWLSARDAPLDLLDAGDYLALLGEGVAVSALSGAIGVGIGAIVRNQVAAVVGTLIYLFVLEPVLGVVSSEVAAYTIGGSQSALTAAPIEDAL